MLDVQLRELMRDGSRRICDLGGGANPVAAISEIERFDATYVVVDSSPAELAKSSPQYQRLNLDIADHSAVGWLIAERGPFDTVVTRWTAEHVPDGRSFHEQVHRLLRPGGTALHLFPTLYSPIFLANRLLPPRASSWLLGQVQDGREAEGDHAKFRPYYSWCRGPSRGQLRRLAELGFATRLYVGFFGHPYYQRLTPLNAAHEHVSRWLTRRPVPALTSYALMLLERAP
ncbi:MAG: class I SAM-dependent methyltransferase [Solirubrobacterales bacterium]|nr:class I SAM-dependent methyltransferase [Solirubrobacterales bacterium]